MRDLLISAWAEEEKIVYFLVEVSRIRRIGGVNDLEMLCFTCILPVFPNTKINLSNIQGPAEVTPAGVRLVG